MMQTPDATSNREKRAVTRVCASKQFPGKLHDLLTYIEANGLDWIISWVHQGKAFMVHSQPHLLLVLPIFFGQTKFRSFQRQLNMWHFERVLVGPFKGAFMHPYFQRGNKALCASMSRHHLPCAEMNQQAFTFGINSNVTTTSSTASLSSSKVIQFILDEKPIQPVRDRLSPHNINIKELEWAEWNRRQDLMKGIEAADEVDAKPRAAMDIQKKKSFKSPNTINTIQKSLSAPATPSAPEKNVNSYLLVLDEEEDWSLLSDCLDRVLHGEACVDATSTSDEYPLQSSKKNNSNDRYMPIEALQPGMETPATPETIEQLFVEFDAL